MNYWLNLFTGSTWDEFRKDGGTVTGFRERMGRSAARVKPGDIFLCYLTGVKQWVGALEVLGPSSDDRLIWSVDQFPVRFAVKQLVALSPEYGVPMDRFEGRLDFYQGPEHRGKFKGFLRMSPNLFKRRTDGDTIIKALRQSERNPVKVKLDPRKLARKPRYFKVEHQKEKKTIQTIVSVPEQDEHQFPTTTAEQHSSEPATRHTEIQHELLKLGGELGFEVWVARNDRGRSYNGQTLGALPGILDELPTQFNDPTTRTIELIDVLWLKGNSFVAAFEIESTTSIYSGLLRMSDLLALQPNLALQLYLVAPEERKAKVEQEITRPTFVYRERPLREVCGFISFEKLIAQVKAVRQLGLSSSLKPVEFLATVAEYVDVSRQDRPN